MKLTDTQTAQLAGAIAYMFENGKNYAVVETTQTEYDSYGTPVVRGGSSR